MLTIMGGKAGHGALIYSLSRRAAILVILASPSLAHATPAAKYKSAVGDGVSAVAAPIGDPTGIAVDLFGNIYLADPVHRRVRKVSADGAISTVPGSDMLSHPSAIAVASNGIVYVIDRGTRSLVVMSPDGTTRTTPFGSELSDPSGIALDATDNLYVADSAQNGIRKMTPQGVISTVSIGRLVIDEPTSLSFSSGYLFILDQRNRRVTRLDVDAGDAVSFARLQIPARGMVALNSGDVYLAQGNQIVLRYFLGGGEIVAGSGAPGFSGDGRPADLATLWAPSGLALGSAGALYVLDTGNFLVRKVTRAGTITTVAGNRTMGRFGDGGPANLASFSCSDVVAAADGKLFVSDPLNHRVAVIGPDGTINTYAGNGSTGYSGDGGLATSATLFRPSGLALSPEGDLFVADTGNNRLRRVDRNGVISTVAGNGEAAYAGDGGSAARASISGPTKLALSPGNNLCVADDGNEVIRCISKAGTIATVATARSVERLSISSDAKLVATDADGNVLASVAIEGGVAAPSVAASHYRCTPDGRGIEVETALQ